MQTTPTDQMISDELQNDLVKLLRHPLLKDSRLRINLIPDQASKLRKMVGGQRKPFRKLSDKPLLLSVMRELEAMEQLLQLTPDDEENI